MRIDLKVPFEQKDEAKSLGAKWDPARKVWHLIDPQDLAPFARWMVIKAQQAYPRNRRPLHEPRTTALRDNSLPNCGCTHAPPWEECCRQTAGR